MPRKVSFITNAGGRFGLGHLTRCAALAEELQDEGYNVDIILGQESPPTQKEKELEGLIHRIAATVSIVDQDGTRSVHPDLKSKIATEQTDTVFLDSYQMGPRFQSQIRETGAMTIVIDDQAFDQYDCDHLINYAPTASEEDYLPLLLNTSTLHLGLDFFPVSSRLRHQHERTENKKNYLCICLGGSGSELITYNLMANLRQCEVLDDFEEVVVINGLSPEKQDQLALGSKLTIVSQPPNYLELINDSRAAITGAGVSALERVYLNNGGVIVVAADNQVPNYNYLTQHDFFAGFQYGTQGPLELNQAIERGLSLSMPNNIIDGLAGQRISKFIGGNR